MSARNLLDAQRTQIRVSGSGARSTIVVNCCQAICAVVAVAMRVSRGRTASLVSQITGFVIAITDDLVASSVNIEHWLADGDVVPGSGLGKPVAEPIIRPLQIPGAAGGLVQRLRLIQAVPCVIAERFRFGLVFDARTGEVMNRLNLAVVVGLRCAGVVVREIQSICRPSGCAWIEIPKARNLKVVVI